MDKTVKKINEFINSLQPSKIVGLDGYSGTGKTTISHEMQKINENIKVLHLDDYIVTANTKEKLEKHLEEDRDHLELEWKNIGENSLETLKKDIEDFKNNSDNKVLLIEGIFFLHPMYEYLFDKIIFLDGDENLADERRIKREKERWGGKYFPEDHPDSFARLFKLAWCKYVELYKPKKNANLVIEI